MSGCSLAHSSLDWHVLATCFLALVCAASCQVQLGSSSLDLHVWQLACCPHSVQQLSDCSLAHSSLDLHVLANCCLPQLRNSLSVVAWLIWPRLAISGSLLACFHSIEQLSDCSLAHFSLDLRDLADCFFAWFVQHPVSCSLAH